MINREVIQRDLWTKDQAKEKVAIRGRWRSKEYHAILNTLDLWHDERNGLANEPLIVQLVFLKKLKKLIDVYITKKTNSKQSTKKQSKKTSIQQEIDNMNKVKENVNSKLTTVQQDYSQSGDDPIPQVENADLGDLDTLNKNFEGKRDQGGLNSVKEVIMDNQDTKGYFKKEKAVDEMYGMHKGTAAGIPQRNPNQTGRAIAAYRIDQLLEAGIIPKTYKATKGGKTGSVMEKISDAKPGRDPYDIDGGSNIEGRHIQELHKLYLMDVITGQVDRHLGNVLLKGGKVWGIDNDLTFGDQYGFDPKSGSSSVAIGGKSAKNLHIDKAFAIKIIKLSNNLDRVRQALDPNVTGLTNSEVEKAIERLENLAEYLIKKVAKGKTVTNWD
ncbi:hypothetical protein [Roseofilum sp. Guam]|uniref:hypothetical protein n=1 Tax=Roseofilum sp. Guam TaxID=2821502 RepID=UPI001B0665B4|nr:hypothetical protein [Roseofilum sp. Guam]MBP0030567.1 hypothetical protein [Roseofilum sp. Guam]